MLNQEVGKLFQKVPYLVRDIQCDYKSIHDVEEVIDEFLSNYMMTIGNLVSVFSNNRDNTRNFHILVNGNMPKDTIYIDFMHDSFEITFEEYKDHKTKSTNITSIMFIEQFKQKKEEELVNAFENMIGCDGNELFISLAEDKFTIYKPNSEAYNNRIALISKKDTILEICELYEIDYKKLYNELNPNIIKKVCNDLNLTYKKLALEIGYKPDTINKSASTGKVSEQLHRAIEMYLENLKLKDRLRDFDIMKETLRKILG